MAKHFTTSAAGYDLIRRFEGLHKVRPDGLVEAYKIGADPWTVGIGQTGRMPDGRRVEQGLVITQEEAEDALQFFVRNVTEPLVRKHFVARSQEEFDALVSWTYNISSAKLEAGQYSLPQLVNNKDRDTEALVSLWMRYIHTPGFENGLTRRRIAELLMFLGLPWNAPSVWGYISTARYKTKDGTVDPTDPWFIIDIARNAKPIPSEPDPPKAPEPVKPVEAEPLPEPAPAPSPIDPDLPPKPMEKSKTAKAINRKSRGQETFGIGALGAFLTWLSTEVQMVSTNLGGMFKTIAATFGLQTPLEIGLALFGILALIGAAMWWSGRNEAYHRRQQVQEAKY